MDYILIVGVFEALLLSMLLLFKKEKSLPDSILAFFFLIFAINILLSFIEMYNRKNGYPLPVFISTTPPFILIHGPALWFYIMSQTRQNFRLKPIYLLHFIPFLAMFINIYFEIISLPIPTKIQLDANEGFKHLPTYSFFLMLILFSPIFYFIWGYRLLIQYNKNIKNYFSGIENIDFKWLRILLISSLILAGIINCTFFVDFFFHFAPFGFLQAASFLFASVYIFFLGFYGLRQVNLFSSYAIKINLDNTSSLKPIDKQIDSIDEDFIYRLLEFMKTNKPFLNPELTISKLSADLNVTEEYLSNILNNQLNKNFYDFINNYRIEEFKTQIIDSKNQNLTLLGIAFNCGFNSKATFNRVFKKATNLTPSEYKLKVSVN